MSDFQIIMVLNTDATESPVLELVSEQLRVFHVEFSSCMANVATVCTTGAFLGEKEDQSTC